MKQFKRTLSIFLAALMLMSMVYIAPAAEAASASTYISTTYAANLSVKTTQAVNLMELPTTSSNAKYTLPVDTMLTVKALHKNTSNTYWYEVLYYDMTLYLDATATTLVDHLTGDVTIDNIQSPASLAYGSSFVIKGDISATLNDLGTITGAMYTSSNITKAPSIMASDEATGKTYSLASSAIDNSLSFGSLAPGNYTYVVTAEAISYYIDDSDALATSAQTVVLETQQCVITEWTDPNDELAFGIDVSTWNGSIDWSKTKNVIDFAILRIGFSETLDNRFLEYAENCEAYGIPYGVYHYSYGLTAAETKAEAEFVINTLETYGFTPDLAIWYDMEDGTQASLSTSLKEDLVMSFCDTIAEAGYQPGFYGFTSWFSSSFQAGYLSSLPQWIAQIDGFSSNGTATYDGGTWLWQYSWEGSISGISGDVDCNYCYAEFPGYSSDTSYLAQCTHYPAYADAVTNTTATIRQYPASSYSSKGTVSSNTAMVITGLYKNASGEYWYQVDSSGIIGYVLASQLTISQQRYDDLAVIDPAMADNINLGSSYSLTGKLVSQYNTIYAANAKIYAGEDTLVTPVLSSTDTPDSRSYALHRSVVDNGLAFGSLSSDYYTYEISADVRNYYVSSGSLKYASENVVLWTAPFTVGSAPIEPPASVACDHSIVTDAAVAATCTTTGLTEGSHCTKCGVVFNAQATIPAKGHTYQVHSDEATCQDYELFHYTCTACGDSYDISADQLSQWSETKPLNVDESLIETKTQYRYADCTSTSWVASGTGSVEYVPSWPSGFDTSNSLYTKYNKASSKVSNSETATTKTVVNSDAQTGYLYYHWCSASDSNKYSYASKSSTHTIFHAYYDTTDPSTYTCDTSDMSYKTSNSCCSAGNSLWFFVTEVYTQSYTTYTATPDGKTWGSWSAWSDAVYTPVENSRMVETRTMYRYTGATLGDHVWRNGVCSLCSTQCQHSYTNNVCTICGMGEPVSDYYLFGNINGANYGCEEDYANVGEYLFVDGKLTVTFTENSYVAVKSADNSQWFMTNGFLGQNVTSATLYNSVVIGNAANKLFVPKGREIIFTLTPNGDGTLTLSYEIGICDHVWVDGVCTECGNECAHHWANGACTMCGKPVHAPVITPSYASLSFESEVCYNVYFTLDDLGDVKLENMGLLTWGTPQSDGTIATADAVIPGCTNIGDSYMVHTNGIPAKYLADTVYFKIYAKLSDGSYVYSGLYNYSAKTYALGRIKSSTNEHMRRLCVAMLNYGAAAQEYFSYKPYNLMNASLTDEQKALVADYTETMVDPVISASTTKASNFVYDSSAFSNRYPSVSFDGAFSINYYFTTSKTMDGPMTFYYWDLATYESVSKLTTANATGSSTMISTGSAGQYWGSVPNIAAKQLDETVFVAAVYESGGVRYTTGVISYSLGKYCEGIAAKDTSDQQALSQATAVYGYYAKTYFANLTT